MFYAKIIPNKLTCNFKSLSGKSAGIRIMAQICLENIPDINYSGNYSR